MGSEYVIYPDKGKGTGRLVPFPVSFFPSTVREGGGGGGLLVVHYVYGTTEHHFPVQTHTPAFPTSTFFILQVIRGDKPGEKAWGESLGRKPGEKAWGESLGR